MTNEQAKNMLKAKLECLKHETSGFYGDCNRCNCDECSLNYEQGNMGEQKKALEIAIKVLERHPCEDCISRKLLSDNICEGISCNECSFNEIDDESGCLLQKRLDELPSVQPKPKTGHWIEHPEIETSTPEYLMFYECSECGDKQCFCKSDIHKKHFCNNCGAKMVEPQEGEE